MTPDADRERSTRLLRLKIARLRRHIDGRVRGVQREGRRLTSWKTYVTRFPGYSLVAAAGLGLAASAGLRRRGLTRLVGLQLLRRAMRPIMTGVTAEIARLWTEAAPSRSSPDSEGGDHGRA